MAILFMDGFEQYVEGVEIGPLPLPKTFYRLGNGKGGEMFVLGDARLMSFAGPHTREGLKHGV